jgi:hypothetical protein
MPRYGFLRMYQSSLSVLHTHVHFNIVLIRRTSGRSLETSKQSNALSYIGGHGTVMHFHAVLCCNSDVSSCLCMVYIQRYRHVKFVEILPNYFSPPEFYSVKKKPKLPVIFRVLFCFCFHSTPMKGTKGPKCISSKKNFGFHPPPPHSLPD